MRHRRENDVIDQPKAGQWQAQPGLHEAAGVSLAAEEVEDAVLPPLKSVAYQPVPFS
ncbi:hypothetical protein [Silvimonas soli]|uniref:hypothetical protein n=1 Tax=Silvimonas soli TaxID=2980100 RepID=UPI0024B3B81A|nr:hypothetical protein [Silvimonas soli]